MKPILALASFILLTKVFFLISCKKEYSCENCKGNKPPIANAGADQIIVLPKDSVMLDGSASTDPDGIITSYKWIKISGPVSSNIIRPDSSKPLAKTLVTGVYKFELTVTDNGGLSAKDTVQIIVNDPAINQPPVANAGMDQIIILPTDSALLDGSASFDPDGTITSYKWTKISGAASPIILKSDSAKTVIKTITAGVYQFELKVTDNGGLIGKDTLQITVKASSSTNLPPVANAGADITVNYDLQACSINAITLNGSASFDPDGTIVDYFWSQLPGPAFGPPAASIPNPSSASSPATDLIVGTYYFILKVTDNNLATDTDTITVKVVSVNRPLINALLVPVGTLSQTRAALAIASAGNKILFAGGYDAGINLSSTVDIYDLSTQSWSTAALSVPRYAIAAAAAGNKILFAGGYNGDDTHPVTYSTADIYDASSNTWSVNSMSVAAGGRAAAVLGDKIFIAGGDHHNGTFGFIDFPAVVDIYNVLTDTWSTSALSEGRFGLSASAAGGKIYFAGGITTSNSCTDKIDIYDGSTGTWSAGTLAKARPNMACIAIGSKIFWAGGEIDPYDTKILNDVEIKDVNTQASSFACLFQPNSWFTAVVKNNKIVFFRGADWVPNEKNKFDIYDLTTNTWSIGVLDKDITSASIISVNNTIYVAGGTVNGVLSNEVWKLEF